MRTVRLLSISAAFALLLAGCGGGGKKVSSGDIAVVGKTHITQAQFDTLMAQAQQTYKAQGKTFPKQGTPEYQTIKSQAVASLVQQAMREAKASELKLTVTDADVEKRLTLLKKQYFGGSEVKYKAQLKKQHLTDQEVRDNLREQLISEKLYNQVTKGVTVTTDEVHQYYLQNSEQYSQPQSRDVRYIGPLKSKTTAESVYRQLSGGNDKTWCTLAKKYAKDSSGQSCGKSTFSKGQTVPIFDTAAFSSPTNKVHKPFYDPTQYKAWFVIEPISSVKPRKVTPEKQVSAAIKNQLLTQKKTKIANDFVATMAKSYCKGIRYQAGYSASPDPCAASSSTTTTTTN
jgi:hypothetical protein